MVKPAHEVTAELVLAMGTAACVFRDASDLCAADDRFALLASKFARAALDCADLSESILQHFDLLLSNPHQAACLNGIAALYRDALDRIAA